MSLFSQLFGITFGVMFIGLIFFVIFGQVTVRRLRKNPKTKTALGTEFASGWDIFNVAQALSLPKSWAKKLSNSPLSALYADVDVLYENTSKLDRLLAFILYWVLMFSVGTSLLLIVCDGLGIFD